MKIALIHSHYDNNHLDEVKKIMEVKGAPVIRAIWSECYGIWLAVEGCHRIRAAKDLGLTPVIKDISAQKYVSYQIRGEIKKTKVSVLASELDDNAYRAAIIDFEG